MDGSEFQYESGDEENENMEIVVKNKRGKGKEWYPIQTHASMAIAKNSIDTDSRKKGRINRGVTMAVYYHCRFKSCDCKIECSRRKKCWTPYLP